MDVPDLTLDRLVVEMEYLELVVGDILFHKGESGDSIYFIGEGNLRLEADNVHLVTRGPGEFVGEYSLIDDASRSASAVAESGVLLLKWRREQFYATLIKEPIVVRGIFRALIGKLRENIPVQVDLAMEKERWRQDLARAREIQMGMLPEGSLKYGALEASGYCEPAVEVGGDYYDFLPLKDDRLGLIIADVTGHGFYSSLFVAMMKSALHSLSEHDCTPQRVMYAMRRALSLSLQRRLLMSCFYVLLDTREQRMIYSNAGHPYPYFFQTASGELHQLESLDPILGALDLDSCEYQEVELPWMPGDLLVMFTDGVLEERNDSGQMFGDQRLEQVILKNVLEPVETIKRAVLDALVTHRGAVVSSDDITLVVTRFQEIGER